MNILTNLAAWPWLLVWGLFASAAGVYLQMRFRPRREWRSVYGGGVTAGLVASIIAGSLVHNPLVVVLAGMFFGYLGAWLVGRLVIVVTSTPLPPSAEGAAGMGAADPVNRVPLRHHWDRRPRFETLENGLFVGRSQLLRRLTDDFTARHSGTVLISGVRGVGKTALVERALIQARDNLQAIYWRHLHTQLSRARSWSPDSWLGVQLLRVSRLLPQSVSGDPFRDAAAEIARYSPRRFDWIQPVMYFTSRVVRRLHEVSGAQLLVLKFDASDISGALADPLPAPDSQQPAGKPQVNPEKLMRALIRKLYSTCHPSQPTAEARVLEWSLRGREEGRLFFSRLAAAYQKSVSKSYKETVSNSFTEALKESQSSAWEFKANLERIAGLLAFAVFLGAAIWVGLGSAGLAATQKYLISGTAGIAAFAALGWTVKRSREVTRDADRQAQFSYEFDYSLAQMENDLKGLLNVLRLPAGEPFDRRRCFTRVVMVFDELDKLENPVEQLNNVITHFKNFFTLSDALFVFITDHQFYEHLVMESARAQQLRQYSTEHTFFTNRIYLRKPEFEHFYEAVYSSCEERALLDAAAQANGKVHVADTRLIDHLLERATDLLPRLRGACLPALTYLVLNLNRYSQDQQALIHDMFQTAGGPSDPFSLATLWAGLVGQDREQQYRDAFAAAGGWNHSESLALLYFHRARFSLTDQPVIEKRYAQLKSPSLKRHQSVDAAPFSLSDIARALCFQSRNHYFDLFYLIHDYVTTYENGVPVLHINDPRFGREQRLWSRYQQMVEAAFRYRREDHPSREYWNGQLMETLYAVFDTRLQGDKTKIRLLAYTPKPSPGAAPNGAADATREPAEVPASAMTPRDIEQINQAVLRLLRLLVARRAVSVGPVLEQRLLHNDQLKLPDIADEEIYWQRDCESEITQEGIGIEPYEQELIDFWDNNRIDLESIEQEIGKLWKFAAPPANSSAAVLRAAVQQLRSTADGLRGRSTTISHPDANTLLSRFAGLDAFAERIPALFAERIQADEDAWVMAATALKEPPAYPELVSTMASRGPEIEEIARLPLRTLVLPRPSRFLGYLLAGPAGGAAGGRPLAQILQPEGRIFWYAPGSEPAGPEPAVPNVTFYYPTCAAQYMGDLFTDYSRFASAARIDQRAALVRGGRYKDRQANLALGGEVLKPSEDPTDVWTALMHPAVGIALAGVMELEARVPVHPPDKLLAMYGVPEGSAWSVYLLIEAVARTVAARFPQPRPAFLEVPRDFEKLLRSALSELVPNEKGDVQDAALQAMTATPHAGMRAFLQVLLRRLVTLRMAACVPHDASVAGAVLPEIVPWTTAALEDIAKEKGMDLSAAFTQLATWLPEFEKRRRTLTAHAASAAAA